MYSLVKVFAPAYIKHGTQLVASLTADLRVASSIPAQSHTLLQIDHAVILLLLLIQEGLLSVTSESICTKYKLTCPPPKKWLGEVLTILT